MERKMKLSHPGEILRMELIEGRGLTITKVAELLKMTRQNTSKILNGLTSITPDVALRIEKVFGSRAEHFLKLQSNYDLQKAKDNFSKNPPALEEFA